MSGPGPDDTRREGAPSPATPAYVEFFAAHGIKLIALLVVIEICFHAWAIRQARDGAAEAGAGTIPRETSR